MKSMTPIQVGAFWAWYNSFNGDNKRSLKRAAEAVGMSPDTITRWHKTLDWDKLADEKDRELFQKLETRVMGQIIRDFSAAKERQRALVAALYRRYMDAIPQMEIADLKIADLIKLMEFEGTALFAEESTAQQGVMLRKVLEMMAPEDRVKFNGAVERLRDGGGFQLPSVGPSSRN